MSRYAPTPTMFLSTCLIFDMGVTGVVGFWLSQPLPPRTLDAPAPARPQWDDAMIPARQDEPPPATPQRASGLLL